MLARKIFPKKGVPRSDKNTENNHNRVSLLHISMKKILKHIYITHTIMMMIFQSSYVFIVRKWNF